jgi:crotonobetainyl-CoA:carnitine CoA-transferase CaiB-like acyl-CoA transferase
MLLEMDYPTVGTIKLLGNPVKLSRTPYSIRLAPPKLGEHTEEVVSDLELEI